MLMQTNNFKNSFFLMRHGESLANKEGVIVSHEDNAKEHYGLSNFGAEQVLASAIRTRLSSDTIIVSSDYKRCIETANIMSDVLDCTSKVEIDRNLRERDFGLFELQDVRNYDLVWQQDRNFPEQAYRKVESVADTLSRAVKVVDTLERRFKGRKILLVGHGDVLQILLAHSRGMSPRFHRSINSIDNAEIRSLRGDLGLHRVVSAA